MRTWQRLIPVAAVMVTVFLADDVSAQRKKPRIRVDPESFEGLKASYAKIRDRLKKGGGKTKAGGKGGKPAAQSRRVSAAITAARPMLEKIADLKTAPALKFLVDELKTCPGALKPLLAESAVRTGAAGLPAVLFQGFAGQKGDTQEAILAAA